MTRLLLLLLLVSAPASAASFDCRKASSPDEVAVCRTPALSAADSEMGALFYAYRKVPMMMGSNAARADDAQAFLARRRACGSNPACLTTAYADRNAALKTGIDSAMQDYFRLQNNPPPCAKP